jgi:hydrogenase maturation protease
MENILVIAYGNPLRCDDGIAWHAAGELKRVLPSSAQVICVHQLTPELAESAGRAELVIFLDAAANGKPGNVVCQPLKAEKGEPRFSHHLTPEGILAVCERLYAAKPRGFLLTLHGKRFEHGEEFSPAAVHAVPRVVELVTNLCSPRANRALPRKEDKLYRDLDHPRAYL